MAEFDNKPEATQGTMDLTDHNKTFAGFIRGTVWVIVGSLAILVFAALTNS